MPKRLSSSLGPAFVDELLHETRVHWPDAVAIRNGNKKMGEGDVLSKRARRSKSLITELFERCRSELKDMQLTPSSCSDLLLSLQCEYMVHSCSDFIALYMYCSSFLCILPQMVLILKRHILKAYCAN